MKEHPQGLSAANRRRHERYAFNGRAKIRAAGLARDCVVVDISDGGIRGIAENFEIPEAFSIIFATGEARDCRLAWRIGSEFGGEFVGRVTPNRKTFMVA
jgi:hypothetical protein